MLKMIISDDEKMICLLISQLLDWENLGIEIVGMAYTGIEAYEMIKEKKPDIVISDIRMPGYDGLELIKKIKEDKIETEFVMISGFKQFEYAQRAMKYGVKYYLLKPIEEEKLLEIVLEIKEAIQEKRAHDVYENKLILEVKETRDKMKKRFLTSILSQQNMQETEAADHRIINTEYKTSFQEGIYQAVFVKLDTEGEVEDSNNSLIDKVEKKITILEEVCEEYITTRVHSGVITLMNYKEDQENIIHQKIEELYDEIKKDVDKFKEFFVFLGVGKKSNRFVDARICMQTAVDAIKYRISISNTGIIYYDNYSFKKYDIEKIITASKKQNYLSKIETGDIEAAEECLVTTLREVKFCGESYSPVLFFDILVTYVDILTDYCKKQGFYDEKYIDGLKQWNIKIDNGYSEKMLLEETKEFISFVIEHITKEKREKDIKPIRIIKKYIEESYMQEINLGQLAQMVDMNTSYLSSIFKKETGMTYSEYLVSCRIEQACKMLVETNKSINDIALKSGYQNARYFSKQFTKQIGLKPSEYRKLYS